MSRLRTRPHVRALQYVALAAYVVFLGFPLLWLVSTALKSSAEIVTGASRLLPTAPTLENFRAAVERAELVRAGTNTLRVALPRPSSSSCSACPRRTRWRGSGRGCARSR